MLFYDANYCMIQRCKKTFFILATFITFFKVFLFCSTFFILKKNVHWSTFGITRNNNSSGRLAILLLALENC